MRQQMDCYGIISIALGPAARREAAAALASLRQHTDLPTAVIGDPVPGADQTIPPPAGGPGGPASRLAKLNLDTLSPFEGALYLDADTRVHGDPAAGFRLLADGWDLAIAPSGRQGNDTLGHLPPADRGDTLAALANPEPLNLQAGVFFFHRQRCAPLFAAWREEWQRFQDQDQGALLRALNRVPLRVWLLGRDWNGGQLIEHLFGRAR